MGKIAKVTISLPQEMLDAVDATTEGQQRSAFFRQAIEQRLSYEKWFREQVQIGIDQADRGELIPADEVYAELDALIAEAKAAQD